MNPRNPRNFTTFAGGNGRAAPLDRRYIGKYYWCAYWQCWDKILGFQGNCWHVQTVDDAGNPIGEVRTHCTSIDPGLIADRPFQVEYT